MQFVSGVDVQGKCFGIHQVFAHSPQAKGRVERLAGTFQDRLVSELRLAGVRTLTEANDILKDFLPRFNRRFGVPADEAPGAYRPLDRDLDLAAILCPRSVRTVAKDNTVKFKLRTLQLLPGRERPSYAGARVEVQERLDGNLVMCSEGQVIPTREAPPRANALREADRAGARPAGPPLWLAERLNGHHAGDQELERRESARFAHQNAHGTRSARIPGTVSLDLPPRRPTPRQQARWNAVQEAKRRGLSIRAIARKLGLARGTVRKYAAASSPPVNPAWQPPLSAREHEELTESLTT